MKITKYLHSCLVIEENTKTIVIDPGIFTYQEKVLDIKTLPALDYILITHEHADHLYLPFIKELITHSPEVKIISNPAIETILAAEQIPVHTDLSQLPGDAGIQFEEVPHENLWDKTPPQNIRFDIFNKLTHPGDSHHFETTKEILALPIQAPWGSTMDAVELALKLKPKVIIPTHDWMWKDDFRKGMYERLTTFFKAHQIDFKGVETGETLHL